MDDDGTWVLSEINAGNIADYGILEELYDERLISWLIDFARHRYPGSTPAWRGWIKRLSATEGNGRAEEFIRNGEGIHQGAGQGAQFQAQRFDLFVDGPRLARFEVAVFLEPPPVFVEVVERKEVA